MATGSQAQRLVAAEDLLCRTEAFRRKVGAADALAAKEKVYAGELTEVLNLVAGGTLDVARPSAILGVERHSYAAAAQNGQPVLLASGAVWLVFTDRPSNPTNHKRSLVDFVDWTSRVMDEMAELVGSDYGALDYTLWPFTQMHQFIEPFRPDVADRQADDYWLTGYVLLDSQSGGA